MGAASPAALVALAGGVSVGWTGRSAGDLRPGSGPDGEERRRAVLDRPWDWVHQVHGADVAVVRAPGTVAGPDGDALVSSHPEAVLAVFTADCAPVALASDEGVFAAVHAGWRGLLAGVVPAAVDAMHSLGAGRIVAALGPCIHPACYAFSPADLDAVAARLGDRVRSTTSSGDPALDVPAAVGAALDGCGAELLTDTGVCTACSGDHFSHRARADVGRQAMVVAGPAVRWS